jgi:hypothetical protein
MKRKESMADHIVDKSQELLVPQEPFESRALRLLSKDDHRLLVKYLAKGGLPLATQTALALYQVFLSGSSLEEIHRINKALPYEAILHAYVQQDWESGRRLYFKKLQDGIHDRMLRANFETLGLLTDMLAVAHKQHGDKFRKYLASGNPDDLKGAMTVDSIHQLLRVLESVNKSMGNDKSTLPPTVYNQQFNVQGGTVNAISSAEAARGLSELANAKKKETK